MAQGPGAALGELVLADELTALAWIIHGVETAQIAEARVAARASRWQSVMSQVPIQEHSG